MERRTFIAGAAVIPLAGAGQVAASDPHLEWLKQWYRARADWIVAAGNDQSGNSDTPECHEAFDREDTVRDQIIATKAETPEGVRAQATFLIADQHDNLKAEYGLGFIQSVIEGLDGVKGLAGAG